MNSWLKENRSFTQRLIVTSLATAVSWSLGQSLANQSGIVAAIVTIITLRISLQASISEAFTQLIGTVIGVLLAFLTLTTIGPSALAVGLTIAGSLTIAKILDLGDEGLVNISVTAIIVLAPGLPEQAAYHRFLGTLVGTFVAVFFSFFNHPDTPIDRVDSLLNGVSRKTSDLLEEMGTNLGTRRYNESNSSEWLARARRYSAEVEHIRPYAEELLRYAKWSPRLKAETARVYYNKFLALEHTTIQVRTIARSLYDSKVKGIDFSGLVLTELKRSISEASQQVAAWRIETGISFNISVESSSTLKNILEAAKDEFAGEINEDQILVLASVLTNVERISDSLSTEPTAIAEVESPIVTKTTIGSLGSRIKSLYIIISKLVRSLIVKIKNRSFFIQRERK